jgi:hypothetical protein
LLQRLNVFDGANLLQVQALCTLIWMMEEVDELSVLIQDVLLRASPCSHVRQSVKCPALPTSAAALVIDTLLQRCRLHQRLAPLLLHVSLLSPPSSPLFPLLPLFPPFPLFHLFPTPLTLTLADRCAQCLCNTHACANRQHADECVCAQVTRVWAKIGVAARHLNLLADVWSFLACLHPAPPQYASGSAWRLGVLEALLEHPDLTPRVEKRTSQGSDALVMTRVWVLGHLAPLLLCGHASWAEATRQACAPELDLKMDLADTASEHCDTLAPCAQTRTRSSSLPSWRAVVLLLRHAAAFSSTHIRMASCHALGIIALQLGDPVRVTIYQHLVALCAEGNATSTICATYLSALDEYYQMLEAWQDTSAHAHSAHHDEAQRHAVLAWRQRVHQILVCTSSLDGMFSPFRESLVK